MTTAQTSAGSLIREWRTRRRMSQLDLAMEADISQRHLSFVESGRAAPSRDMVLHLAEQLSIPLRQRNQLLLAAGFAPELQRTSRSTDASLAPAMAAVEIVLKGHEPFPALAVDRHWNLVSANARDRPVPRRRRGGLSADTAGQCAAAEPAPWRHRAAHRQPRGMARASARAAEAPERRLRRPGADRIGARASDLSVRR